MLKRKRRLIGSKFEAFDESGGRLGEFHGPTGGGASVAIEAVRDAYNM